MRGVALREAGRADGRRCADLGGGVVRELHATQLEPPPAVRGGVLTLLLQEPRLGVGGATHSSATAAVGLQHRTFHAKNATAAWNLPILSTRILG